MNLWIEPRLPPREASLLMYSLQSECVLVALCAARPRLVPANLVSHTQLFLSGTH